MNHINTLFTLIFLISSTIISQQIPPEWDFRGRYLIAMSDADMLPSAYENGLLGPIYGKDKLSVISLDRAPKDYSAQTVDASNSVAGPPSVVAVTPNGDYAFVIETFSPRPGKSDKETFADFKLGNTLTIIDLTNPDNPKKKETIEIAERPLSVSINNQGTLLAISYHPLEGKTEHPISLHRIEDGNITQSFYPEIPSWSLKHELTDVVWHPKRQILSLINNTESTVRFVEVEDKGKTITLSSWGNEIQVGKYAFIGRFTEDGNHFLANNLFWGPDIANTWTEAPRGTIVNIKLNHFQKEGKPIHSLTSQVMAGPSPEGFAVSTDGRYVAALNMERSWLPYDDDRQSWFSSISLLERDPETGAMSHLNTIPYYAVLPEMAVFDASGRYLAVVCSDQYDHSIEGGALDFFKIVKDPVRIERETLVQTRYSVPLQHGPHDLILVK